MALAEIPRHTRDYRTPLNAHADNHLAPELLNKIAELRALPYNWDGYYSPPIADVAAAGAIHILEEAEEQRLPRPYIGPATGGGVQIEWHLPSREVELEVLPDGSIGYITIENGDYSEDASFPSYWDRGLSDLLRWLADR